MKKLINGLFNNPTTSVTGGCAGVIQIKQGLETHNYWLIASGVLTLLMGVFAKDSSNPQ